MVGDGTTDDTAAIQMAINGTIDANSRCGQHCDSSTTTPALVYFPYGTYLISSSIVMMYYTQLVGDATKLPTIKGSSTFISLGMLDADPYSYGGANWYTNQNNFYRQVRNFIFDMTEMPTSGSLSLNTNVGIHWQVAQATSLQNIVFNMKPNSTQTGVWMDNGSANFFGDLIFNGGGACLYVGNQQYTIRNITFNGCQTGIYQNWGMSSARSPR
jgi:glucan 1,3-beta-glucosidase